jgi:hypothetical protein
LIPVLRGMNVSFRKPFSNKSAQPDPANVLFSILREHFYERVLYLHFLNDSDVGGPGHRTHRVLTHAIDL